MRILHTGDLHLGKSSKAGEKGEKARMDALDNVIRVAEERECDYMVIAGDLFDKKYPPVSLVKEVCKTLGGSPCPVMVLPGNHDYYGDGSLWGDFERYMGGSVTLMKECTRYETSDAVFYACPCDSRCSDKNKLSWLKEDTNRSDKCNIGVAHGAIEGLSCDKEKRYFSMAKEELESLGMELWLIGHTHIPYSDVKRRIFNAGTHQQTDIADSSEGSVFVIDIAEDKTVTFEKVHTGVFSYVERDVKVPHGQRLAEAIKSAVKDLDRPHTWLRLKISGYVPEEDYEDRKRIYYDEVEGFAGADEPVYSSFFPEISLDMINAETAEGTVENKLLRKYLEEGKHELLSLTMDIVKSCKSGGKV